MSVHVKRESRKYLGLIGVAVACVAIYATVNEVRGMIGSAQCDRSGGELRQHDRGVGCVIDMRERSAAVVPGAS